MSLMQDEEAGENTEVDKGYYSGAQEGKTALALGV